MTWFLLFVLKLEIVFMQSMSRLVVEYYDPRARDMFFLVVEIVIHATHMYILEDVM